MTRARWQKQPPRSGGLLWIAEFVQGAWTVWDTPQDAPEIDWPHPLRYWSVPVSPPPFLPGARPKVRR